MPDTPTTTPITPTQTPFSTVCVSNIVGSPALVTGEQKYGISCAQFDGHSLLRVSDYPSFNFGVGDFCVELWFKKIAHNSCHLVSQGTSLDRSDLGFSLTIDSAGKIWASLGINGNVYWLSSGSTVVSDTLSWHHVAVSRSNGQDLILILDGNKVDQQLILATDTLNDSVSYLEVGGLFDTGTNSPYDTFIGYIDDLRISKVSRYTVSSTAAPSAGFTCDQNTVLLLNMESGSSGLENACANCPSTPVPVATPTATPTCIPLSVEITQEIASTPLPSQVYVNHPIPDEFKVGSNIIINKGAANEEEKTISHINISEGIFLLSSALQKTHAIGESVITDCCTIYQGFEFGLSFPDNVKKAVKAVDINMGPTGPSGPMGPTGPIGGINEEASVSDILTGNGHLSYVSPANWFTAANRYVPLIWTETITNGSFIPNTLDYAIFDITYNGTCSLSAPSNFGNGRTITIVLRRGPDADNLFIANEYLFDGGYEVLSSTPNAIDVIIATNINGLYFCTIANDIKRL